MRRLFEDFAVSRNGTAAVLFAFGGVVFAGMLALGVDLGILFYNRQRLQVAAEAAALAAAKKLPSTADAGTKAIALAALNVPPSFGTVTGAADVTTGTYDATSGTFTSGTSSPNAVKVTARRDADNSNAVPLSFASVFGLASADVSASALSVHTTAKTCFYVLDPTASPALDMRGSSAVSVPCGVQVNSSAVQAVSVSNNATLKASKVCVDGGVSGTTTPAAVTGCPSMSDPLAYLAAPTASSCMSVSGSTLSAGTYCGSTTFSGVTLSPGVYYIHNGSLSFKQTVTGSGVMIYLDANSSFNVTSGADITVSAPTSGTYRGIVLFQARDTPSSTVDAINGGGTVAIDGAIYIPSAKLSLAGSTGTVAIGYVVADEIETVGSTTFQVGTPSGYVADVFSKSYLVQ